MTDVVVSDTSPLQYLHQSRTLDLLPQLFGRVIVPPAVIGELAETEVVIVENEELSEAQNLLADVLQKI